MLKTRLQVQIRSTGHRGQPADTDGRHTQRTPANTQTANRKQSFRLEDNRIIGLTNSHRNKKLIRYDRGEQILPNSGRQKGVIKEVPYRVPANNRRCQTTLSSPGNLSPGICVTKRYTGAWTCRILWNEERKVTGHENCKSENHDSLPRKKKNSKTPTKVCALDSDCTRILATGRTLLSADDDVHPQSNARGICGLRSAASVFL